jgi:hypothetical protein
MSDYLQSLQDAADAALAERQQRAQAAYDANMSTLNDSYNKQLGMLSDNYNSTLGQLGDARDYSQNNINDDAAKSLKEAYINKMLTQRNLAQNLSAQGLSGGMSESTAASLNNNYGNSRNNITTQQQKSISDLLNTYNQNVASARQNYNEAVSNAATQKAQYEMELRNQLENLIESAYSSYDSMQSNNSSLVSQMDSLLSNQQGYTYDPTSATNSYSAVNTTQATPAASDTNWEQYLKALQGTGTGNNATYNAQLVSASPTVNTNSLGNFISSIYGK